jgi:hypothetical protein
MLWTRKSRRRTWPRQVVLGLVALVTLGNVEASGTSNETNPSVEEKRAALFLQWATYGPRPGDFANILETGTEAWLEEQLHPERNLAFSRLSIQEATRHHGILDSKTKRPVSSRPTSCFAVKEPYGATWMAKADSLPSDR